MEPAASSTACLALFMLLRRCLSDIDEKFVDEPAKDIYDDGRLFLDFSEQTASLNGKPLTLSPMEYKMLNLFRKNPRQVLTRGQLLEKLWDIDERFVDEHTLTTSISRIRSKIESDGGAPYIKTVYGMGYQWTGGEAK